MKKQRKTKRFALFSFEAAIYLVEQVPILT